MTSPSPVRKRSESPRKRSLTPRKRSVSPKRRQKDDRKRSPVSRDRRSPPRKNERYGKNDRLKDFVFGTPVIYDSSQAA